MKGVVIERALASNTIDVYALLKQAFKEGSYNFPDATPEQIKNYYYVLLEELKHPHHFVYLARKGRQYMGYLQAQLLFRPFGQPILFLQMVYVSDKKRKLGIGKALLAKIVSDARSIGVSSMELLCDDKLLGYWEKKGFKKTLNFMVGK